MFNKSTRWAAYIYIQSNDTAQPAVSVMARAFSPAECIQVDIKLQLLRQTIRHPLKITRCQRCLLGKCLPRDTQLGQRGLPPNRQNKSSADCKSPSLWSSGHAEHNPQPPKAYPHSSTAHWWTLSPHYCVTGHQQQCPWDRADGLPLVCLYRHLCQSPGSATVGTVLSVTPHPLSSMWEWGEQRGERWTQCLHHQHSGTLCTLIQDYWGAFQTGSNTCCGGNVQGDTVAGPLCECRCVFELCSNKRLPMNVL